MLQLSGGKNSKNQLSVRLKLRSLERYKCNRNLSSSSSAGGGGNGCNSGRMTDQ